ncbi:MAG: hypothetical protein RLZ12_250 [Bacillota bacterium]|jgi:hypothetical protein
MTCNCSADYSSNATHLITNKLTTTLNNTNTTSRKDIYNSYLPAGPYATINNASLTLCYIDQGGTTPTLELFVNTNLYRQLTRATEPVIINLPTNLYILTLGLTGGDATNLVSVSAILSIVYTLPAASNNTSSIASGCCA